MDNVPVKTTITIMVAGTVKSVGDKKIPLLSFKAKDNQGQEHNYQTYNQSLFDSINQNVGKDIEVDCTTKVNGDYTNRTISQVYVDGKPVGVKPSFNKSGGTSDIQVAIKSIIDLRIAKIIDDNSTQYKQAIEWINKTLGGN